MKARNAAAVASVIGQLAGLYAWKIRPWMMQWGATPDEQTAVLPGDALFPNPTHVTTHAITINARPEEIWPWLVQMGQNRAGFYTHNWIEKLLLSGIPDVHEIHPEWQSLKIGDIMRTNREIQKGHPIGWRVAVADPNRAVVVRSASLPVGTYAYVLTPLNTETTRLISRDRAVWRWWETPFRLLIFEPLHTYMQTGVLRGIKQRADGISHAQLAAFERNGHYRFVEEPDVFWKAVRRFLPPATRPRAEKGGRMHTASQPVMLLNGAPRGGDQCKDAAETRHPARSNPMS